MSEIYTYAAAVALDSGSAYLQDIACRQFLFRADTPLSNKGKDMAPQPSEYLVAALASCTSITIKMYADLKQWVIHELKVEVKHQKTKDKTQWLERRVFVSGELTDAQKQKLLEIADKCPVHKLLEPGIEIRTALGS